MVFFLFFLHLTRRSYPDCERELEKVFIARSGLKLDTIPIQFTFSKYKSNWIYIYLHINKPNSPLKNIAAFAVCICTTDYNPEKYLELSKVMSSSYQATGDPVKILECFISVFVKGSFNSGNAEIGVFNSNDHDQRKAYLAASVKGISVH
jgi:hypothetical protein